MERTIFDPRHEACITERVRSLPGSVALTTSVISALVMPACGSDPLPSGVEYAGNVTTTSNWISSSSIDETDLLLVIDNSPRMADKQALLQKAIPALVDRMLFPPCVDSDGVVGRPDDRGRCPEGAWLSQTPLEDVNVGIITTSLGGHGSRSCARGEPGRNNDDRAWLLPTGRADAPDPDGTGFLQFRYGKDFDREETLETLRAQVEAIGFSGCEYPAPLEAAYRFLIEPSPPEEIVLDPSGRSDARRDEDGDVITDYFLLAQREAFLRPRSQVIVLLISDQEDCSFMDGGSAFAGAHLGHLGATEDFTFPLPSPVCADNPNDRCCFSCLDDAIPEGCDASYCEGEDLLAPEDDRPGVRCFDMKRRFGVELRYPIERYVDGLSRPQIVDTWSGETVDNPLLRGAGKHAGTPRDPSLIFFGSLTGVPWQTIAPPSNLGDPTKLEYLTSAELYAATVDVGQDRPVNRWELLLGEPDRDGEPPRPPLDPFVVASIEPRPTGATSPITGDPIVIASSLDPRANAINGHEVDHSLVEPNRYPDGGPARDALQPSCLFPLEVPRDCTTEEDCICADEPSRNRAICQPPAGGEASPTQYFASATPAPRILQVARDFGANALVGSVCPKNAAGIDSTDPSYGFTPILEAAFSRLSGPRGPGCFDTALPTDREGQVPCVVLEAWIPSEYETSGYCETYGRITPSTEVTSAHRQRIEERGYCGPDTSRACDEFIICELPQLEGFAQTHCQFHEGDPETLDAPGYCYIDEATRPRAGSNYDDESRVVRNCPSSKRQMIRFVGPDTPHRNSLTFIACQSGSIDSLGRDAP